MIIIIPRIKSLFFYIQEKLYITFYSLKYKNINNKNYFPQADYYKDEFDKMESLKKRQKYFNICIEGKLINDIPSQINSNEKILISVVIPVFNTNDKIRNVVRSAQNQNISSIEIVLVNDFSNNETIRIIKINKSVSTVSY